MQKKALLVLALVAMASCSLRMSAAPEILAHKLFYTALCTKNLAAATLGARLGAKASNLIADDKDKENDSELSSYKGMAKKAVKIMVEQGMPCLAMAIAHRFIPTYSDIKLSGKRVTPTSSLLVQSIVSLGVIAVDRCYLGK